MKLYNHQIRFIDRNNKYERTHNARESWVASQRLDEERMLKDIEQYNMVDGSITVSEYAIVEKEFPSKFVIEGELGDNGQWYEDFEITVGGKELYELYSKLKGNNVRLTVEILGEQ